MTAAGWGFRRVAAVCDSRQSVYVTNHSAKNSGSRRAKVIKWIYSQQKAQRLRITEQTESFRCNQAVCDYADALYPDMPLTTSPNAQPLDSAAVHLVHTGDLDQYRSETGAQEPRWQRNSRFASPEGRNFGEVKGMAFDRVLILPTGPTTGYAETGALPQARGAGEALRGRDARTPQRRDSNHLTDN
jgi:hypothetical protein